MEAKENVFDVITIGSGIGGLVSAALLAKRGANVLVLEQHSIPGGCASTFRRKKYIFDAAVHLMGGAEKGGDFYTVLEELDLLDRVEFQEVNPFYSAVVGGDEYQIPANLDEFSNALVSWFPAEAEAIQTVMYEVKTVGLAVLYPKLRTPEIVKGMQGARKKPVEEYLAGRFQDWRIPVLIASLFPYIGTTPDEMDTLFWMGVLASYHGGAFVTKGSTQKLADALVASIKENGGTVLFRHQVEEILVTDGEVAGVRDHKGNHYYASTVITNADMRTSLLKLTKERPDNVQAELDKMEPTHSALVLYAGIHNDGVWEKQWPHEMFVFPEEQYSKANNVFDPLNPEQNMWFCVCSPTRSDETLAPEGHSILSILIPVDFAYIEQLREKCGKEFVVEAYLNYLERHMPGLRERIDVLEVATPRTIVRYTGNTEGALYGWKKSFDQSWGKSTTNATAIPGLYAAGHWTNSGHGVFGVMRSALAAVRTIERAWKFQNV